MQRRLITTVVLWLVGPGSVFAASTELGPGDNIEAAIQGLGPGDELVLRGGLYTLTERFSFGIAGTAQQPILIRAKDGERPHLMRPNANENLIDIDQADYVTIRGIEFSGGSAGLRISAARFLTIEACEIHDTGDVALRANDTGVTYESLRILNNHIHDTHDTGEGMYLGCNNDGCRLANSLIAGNWVHHTNAADVAQGDGIEIKEGSHDNIIRDNVIHDTNYPCILTYSATGNGGPNLIERNVMWNCGDHGIQAAADAIIRNNLILSAGSDGIAMQQHQSGAPSNLVVVHNTILKATNDAISVRSNTGNVLIANNALFAPNGDAIFIGGGMPGLITVVGNAGQGNAGGGLAPAVLADLVNAHLNGAPPIDLFPAPGGALIAAGDPAQVVADDFNGTPRNGVADIGAYAFAAGGNPGWVIGAGFKDAVGVVPPPFDAGLPDLGSPDADQRDLGPPADDASLGDASPGDVLTGLDVPAGDGGNVDASRPDAGPAPDAGGTPEVARGSCGCTTSGHGGEGPTLSAVLAVLLVRRRRRAR
jgi:MYXO-CTERM domain-containing protein